MRFAGTALQALQTAWVKSPSAEDRACGENLWLEERCSKARFDIVEEVLAVAPTNLSELHDQLVDYYRDFVRIPASVSHAFSTLNQAAAVAISSEVKLVRLEALRKPLEVTGLKLADLQEALPGDTLARRVRLDTFCEQWNINDAVPRNPIAFAAIKDELLDELAAPDWADQLRDRLGLAFYDAAAGAIDVGLVEYEAGEIAGGVFAPTVFDSAPWEFFFPTPVEANYGCPLCLKPITSDEDLVAEIIHPRLSYRRQHLVRVGQITTARPHLALSSHRSDHLMALQLSTGRFDFEVRV